MSNAVAAVVTPENETKMILDRIIVLQKELREKQVRVAMGETTVIRVSFLDKSPTKLGAVVYLKVIVNEVIVTVLIDTGHLCSSCHSRKLYRF